MGKNCTPFRAATLQFERWLAQQTTLIRADLRHKHTAMSADPFSFLRATYYRWAAQFDFVLPKIAKAPEVLAVGDLHIENFGTWRDAMGRLAWGVNDFDEAHPLAYTSDLVRLAASALLLTQAEHLRLRGKTACRAILEGYREALSIGGRPFVIGEEHRWFKPILRDPPRDPGRFWDKLRALPHVNGTIPKDARTAIASLLPSPKLAFEVHHRVAGLGSLGKPRYTAIAEWEGGPVAREAKALTRSAVAWTRNSQCEPYYGPILAAAMRPTDPYLKVCGKWIVRRLAPDCRRIELSSLTRVVDEEWLLHAMGFETANVHLGTRGIRGKVQGHLERQPKDWLKDASVAMRDAVLADFESWTSQK
jgi:hypothetical protein